MIPFRPSDRAYCVNAPSSGTALRRGTLYFVERVETTSDGEQYLFLLGSPEEGWNASRFRRVDGQDKLWPDRRVWEDEK